MDPALIAALAGLLGLVTGAFAVGAARFSERSQRAEPAGMPSVPDPVVRLLNVLPQVTVVVDSSGLVLRSSMRAQALGVVRGDRVVNQEIASMVSEVLRDGVIRDRDLEVGHPGIGRRPREMHVRVAPVSSSVTLVLLEDLSESRRIDAVRRDFVANVSHELKTPVGALGLLAEAVEAASDDPTEVRHFAGRMRVESARLTALVNDIIDLSRLQSDNPLEDDSVRVSIDRVVAEAIDATRLAAAAKDIEVISGGTPELEVLGQESNLVTALRNLLSNAVNYSPEHTRVAVGTRVADGVVEVSVTDQGIGVPEDAQSRIFERFYRVDQARSRITGGTGLGLSIVKHVCANHGGDVTVWSRPGEGSTFTLRLPAMPPANGMVQDEAVGS